MNQDSFSFVMYVIHACANQWGVFPSEVFRKLQSAGCIEKYLVPHYDILHTQGVSYIVNDVEQYLKNKNQRSPGNRGFCMERMRLRHKAPCC